MILDYLYHIKKVKNLVDAQNVIIKNTCDNFNINLVAIDFLKNEKSIFVVTPNIYIAQKYYDELINLVSEEDVLFFPSDELITACMLMESGDFKYERINTILSLLENNNKKIIITNFAGAIHYEFSKEYFCDSIINIHLGDTIDIFELIRKLQALGYKNEYTITKTGEFSHRGSILDIFPLNHDKPIRIDFFGDEIDTLKSFDIETQRSIENISEVTIYPVTELIYDDNLSEIASKAISDFILNNKLKETSIERLDKARCDIEERNNLDMLTPYISFFKEKLNTIFDFRDNRKVYFIDPYKIDNEIERMHRDLEEYALNIGDDALSNITYFLPIKDFLSLSNVICEGVVSKYKTAVDALVIDVAMFKSNPTEILKEIKSSYKIKNIILAIEDDTRYKYMMDYLEDNNLRAVTIKDISNITPDKINVIREYGVSFNMIMDGVIVLSEKNLFEVKYAQRKIKFKSIYKNTYKISKYDELKQGDYVVHYDYGVGKYLGLKTMESQGLKRDYLQVQYAKGDNLYIPLEQIQLIQKYAAPDDRIVKLNDLSSGQWAKAKMKVRKKVRDISDMLIKLYSARKTVDGFRYSKDSSLMLEFESDFKYEETPDQLKAIQDVKRDMESSHPMDRLVCGDVGYGKTEVALRASMKAVLDGKQVCVLAPTTILSRQHYYTFKERMDKYAVRVELLNRFVSSKKQKEIIEGIKTGSVDVVIGTHRVLSKEIEFKDLGLLVIDEEQRFGVTHKERIREMKVNVDTITLSATPIPRTLQMSLAGIRELSMIETPPRNRYPIQTYVLERNDSIIRDAITREMSRGGQVFYMYNKVEDIDLVASHIGSLVPEARICIGHGKMNKEDLENTLVKFIDHEYDILVCTTIIETGLDIPDTNTIIVHDADRLGLSQLYQIRGRVGRSDKIAYAYLMFAPKKILTEDSQKRLAALKEFSDLGSGFRIAMRDLAIRGAGDILGAEQSGFIESVGIETYMQILEEEIKNKENNKEDNDVLDVGHEKDVSLSRVYTSRHIDDKYISSDDVRIEIHKKIDKIETIKDLISLEEELTDRFGQFSNELENYMYEKLFKKLCDKLEVIKIENDFKLMSIYISDSKSREIGGEKLFLGAHNISDRIKLLTINSMTKIMFNKLGIKDNSYFKTLDKYLDMLVNN